VPHCSIGIRLPSYVLEARDDLAPTHTSEVVKANG
jgi:hypothetical protein